LGDKSEKIETIKTDCSRNIEKKLLYLKVL
jgi:hypothetical protein